MTAKIVMFDGVCNLCCGAVNFIIRRDPAQRFCFVPLQSERARRLIDEHQIPVAGMDSFVLIDGDRYYLRSDAALRVAAELQWPWSMCQSFTVIPHGLRDWLYQLLGRHRYRLFGQRSTCMLPSSNVAGRFLDST